MLEAHQQVDDTHVTAGGGVIDSEIAFETRRFQVEIDREHLQATSCEQIGHMRKCHRASDAALERIESENHDASGTTCRINFFKEFGPQMRNCAFSLDAAQRLREAMPQPAAQSFPA